LAKGNISTGKENTIKIWWENGKQYITGVMYELKKVYWPGRTQLIGYTGVVLFSVTLVALIIWLFDSGLSFLLERLMKVFA
jgi:preprotein translocase subunit SecE